MRILAALTCVGVFCCLGSAVSAQVQPKPPAAAAAKKGPSAAATGRYRVLAPGVEITIPANVREEETFSTHHVVEILQGVPDLTWTPKLHPASQTLKELATDTVFRRKIWSLEFTFKPVRMIWVDVPQGSGKMQRRLVWYMLYHVKNNGGAISPEMQANGTYTVKKVDEPVTFSPQFVLESHEYAKAYLDRVIPVAIEAIRKKEDPKRKLLSSVEMAAKPIPVSTPTSDRSVWGVATWENVDPRVDFFSVYVQGLSNAYKWIDAKGNESLKPGDPPGKGRKFAHKTLVLNFWRPGDEYQEDQRVIRFGVPGQVDQQWVYR